jgi:aminopeptidase N
MLRHYYSPDKLLTFLRTTMQTYDGDLISGADLRVVANKVFGENMDWFFDQYIDGMGIPEVAYKFNDATPAEDGKGWIITGRLEQVVKWDGKTIDGKFFTKLMVPMTVDTANGPVQVKEYMDGASKDLRIRVEGKPKGAPKIQDELVWITTRSL